MSVGKWAANALQLLPGFDSEQIETKSDFFQEQEVVSALGLKWDSKEDVFCFKSSFVAPDTSIPVTKRSVLSEVSKLFDPIGWLSPVIIRAKVLIQNLWLLGSNWDDPIPKELAESWGIFQGELKDLELIKIPRWLGSFAFSRWELHCFCDASDRAFAAAVYAVVINENDIKTSLMTAKAKVAPIKAISIPKLELCGAILAARLIVYILSKIDRKPFKIYCWSDSKVVLPWVQGHPSRWKTFVANRVNEIKTSLPDAEWRQVRSADNPADLATRGVNPTQLGKLILWRKGPPWLSQPLKAFSQGPEVLDTSEEINSASPIFSFVAEVSDENSKKWLAHLADSICKHSSLVKIIRILSYIFRWRSNAKRKSK